MFFQITEDQNFTKTYHEKKQEKKIVLDFSPTQKWL